jgi:membrane protease YdiL (CAAX protease family)
VLLAGLFAYFRVDWPRMLAPARREDYPPAIKLTLFVLVFSIAAAYALFYPLSFLAPDFVTYWFIDLPPLIYYADDAYPILPNVLNYISLVVMAPLVEEFSFRGILLHRWTQKWGMMPAILASSALFGIAHPDPVGATVFGVAMCVLYLRTQTLVVPIVCHALNNGVAWLIEAGYIAYRGPEHVYTLEDFQSEWIIGLVSAIVCFLWAAAYLKRARRDTRWVLPRL